MPGGHLGLVEVRNQWLDRFVASAAGPVGTEVDSVGAAEPARQPANDSESFTFYRGIAIGIACAMPLWALLIWGVTNLLPIG